MKTKKKNIMFTKFTNTNNVFYRNGLSSQRQELKAYLRYHVQ